MILNVSHLSKSYNEEPVLTDVSFKMEKGEKLAVIGINGAGKTTLLRLIMGEEEADSGEISFARDLTVGYLSQIQNVDPANTIYQELLSVKQPVIDLSREIEAMERGMDAVAPEELSAYMDRYQELRRQFELMEGYGYESEISGVLNGLGISRSEADQQIAHLSGGQKTRCCLGKLLLQKPDLIILDEPTNHLDIRSIRWLEGYLSAYRGAVLIVSHDRYFIDKIAGSVLELECTRSRLYHGNYSFYAQKKQKDRELAMKAYLSNQSEIRRQEEIIARLRSYGREKFIKRAQSREKVLAKMEVTAKPIEMRDEMHLSLTPCIQSGRDVLDVTGLGMSFGDRQLFSDLEIALKRGEHVALVGDNGTGKTTILKILNGLLAPLSGRIKLGVNVHVGYYDQELHVLDPENTIFEELALDHPEMTNTQIRSLLASFLFTGEDVFKPVSALSGGEKGRVSLAKLMLSEANFLMLDEPTNHLDIISKEVLEQALNAYEGTVLYVSHDRYFINRTASRILQLKNGRLYSYPGNEKETAPERFYGNYDYFLEKSGEGSDTAGFTADAQGLGQAMGRRDKQEPSPAKAGGSDWKTQKDEAARKRKLAADVARAEARIAELEAALEDINAELSDPEKARDPQALTELSIRQNQLGEELEEAYRFWEEKASEV